MIPKTPPRPVRGTANLALIGVVTVIVASVLALLIALVAPVGDLRMFMSVLAVLSMAAAALAGATLRKAPSPAAGGPAALPTMTAAGIPIPPGLAEAAAAEAAAKAAKAAAGGPSYEELRRELDRSRELQQQLALAKQEAEAATMAKGEFLATMSHEIRTPLNGIIPLLDIALSTNLNADQKDYISTAFLSAKQLLSIVDDILDYSKIEANKLELEVVGLNLREVVDSVARLMANNAEQKNLKLSIVLDPNVRLAMRGDPVRLRQVLTNLVSNAVKFTERGSVTIDVKKRSESRTHTELLFSIKDTGIGISAEAQQRLFKPFSQAESSVTRNFGGTGLGLVICKRIVDLMGGQIGVQSEIGRGSTFWFTAPLAKAVGDVAPARTDLQGGRAMIVTTEQQLLRRLSSFLQIWGVNFAHVTLTTDALAKLRSAAAMGETWAYDFLILDWGTLKNSALGLARSLLREASLESLRLISIAGDEEMPAEFRGSPRMAVLGRSFTDQDLRGTMQRLFDSVGSGAASVESMLGPQNEGQAAPVEPLPSAPAPSGNAPAVLPAAAPAAAAPMPAPAPALAPVTAAASAPAAVATVAPPSAQMTGPVRGHVLLVEDNAVNRQVAQRLLSLIGISFEHAENGKLAVDMLGARTYDAVLMDCMMPVMDGYAATRAVRRQEHEGLRKGHIAIVAMTANAMAGDREKCLAAGMDDYMSKPLNRGVLEQMLRRWLPADAQTRDGAAVATPSAAPAPAPAPQAAAPSPMHAPAPVHAPAPAAAPQLLAQPSGPVPTAPAAARPAAAPRPAATAASAAVPPSVTAAARSAATAPPAVDAEIVKDLIEMMGNEFGDLMRVYLEDTPKSLALLDLAVKNDNTDALIAPAHSLKSTSANLGATHLSELAKRLEQGARTNTLPMAPAVMVAQLVAEYQRVRTEFKRLLTPQR